MEIHFTSHKKNDWGMKVDQQKRIVTRFLKSSSQAKKKGVQVGWTIIGIDAEDHTNSNRAQFTKALRNVHRSLNPCILRFAKSKKKNNVFSFLFFFFIFQKQKSDHFFFSEKLKEEVISSIYGTFCSQHHI